ncbi:MAG: glycosyltransferase [Clostridia bacterium]
MRCQAKRFPLSVTESIQCSIKREKKIVESLETRYICVARFSPQKNHAMLIEAFASVKSQIANAKLYLVGGGELEDQICAQVNQLGLQESVILTGETSDVKQYLSSCDVFVMASDYERVTSIYVRSDGNESSCCLN